MYCELVYDEYEMILVIKENYTDIEKYYCDKKFGDKYIRNDPKVINYKKTLETKWLQNKIDLVKLFQDIDFKNWLWKIHEEDADNLYDKMRTQNTYEPWKHVYM